MTFIRTGKFILEMNLMAKTLLETGCHDDRLQLA